MSTPFRNPLLFDTLPPKWWFEPLAHGLPDYVIDRNLPKFGRLGRLSAND